MTRENLNTTPREYITWAEKDFKLKDRRGISNGWNNLKQAIDAQLDLILRENNFLKEAKTWDLPSKLQKIKDLGYTTPDCFKRLFKIRNYLIHRKEIPKEDSLPYVDVIKSFINESSRKIKENNN